MTVPERPRKPLRDLKRRLILFYDRLEKATNLRAQLRRVYPDAQVFHHTTICGKCLTSKRFERAKVSKSLQWLKNFLNEINKVHIEFAKAARSLERSGSKNMSKTVSHLEGLLKEEQMLREFIERVEHKLAR